MRKIPPGMYSISAASSCLPLASDLSLIFRPAAGSLMFTTGARSVVSRQKILPLTSAIGKSMVPHHSVVSTIGCFGQSAELFAERTQPFCEPSELCDRIGAKLHHYTGAL